MKKKKNKEKKDGYEDDFDGLNIDDFKTVHDPRIPPPAEIARSLKNARLTIVLDGDTVDFFKDQAKRNDVKYQQLLRQVLRRYKDHYQPKKAA